MFEKIVIRGVAAALALLAVSAAQAQDEKTSYIYLLEASYDDGVCTPIERYLQKGDLGGPGFAAAGFTLPPLQKPIPAGFEEFGNQLFYGDVLWDGDPREFLVRSYADAYDLNHGVPAHDVVMIFKAHSGPTFHHFTKAEIVQRFGTTTYDVPQINNTYIDSSTVDFHLDFEDILYRSGMLYGSSDEINLVEYTLMNWQTKGLLASSSEFTALVESSIQQRPFIFNGRIYFFAWPGHSAYASDQDSPATALIYHLSGRKIVETCYFSLHF